MRRKFGWSYPPGAANDPAAPYNQSEPPEVQHAEVTIRVALPVEGEADETWRKKAILRKLRLSEYADDLELRPGLREENVELTEVETMDEQQQRDYYK